MSNITHEIYLKIYQADGRIENFHFSIVKIDPILDIMNHAMIFGGRYETISKDQFFNEVENAYESILTMLKIDIHEDKEVQNDAAGDKIGYMEHYELKP